MENLPRYLMIGGAVLFLAGGGIYLAGKFGLPFGRLPGDFRIENGDFILYFPLTSMLILSAALTVIVNLAVRLFK